jgi:tRNA-dihydrouridine synthase
MQIEHRRGQARDEAPEESERLAIRELRKHLLWYTRGRRGGVLFRRDASELRTAADVAALLERHFPPGSAAFEEDPEAAGAQDAEGA